MILFLSYVGIEKISTFFLLSCVPFNIEFSKLHIVASNEKYNSRLKDTIL